MPTPSPYALTVLLAIFASCVGAWTWVILRLALGLRVLPPKTPRLVPWGAGSVLMVVVCWMISSALISNTYARVIRPAPAEGVQAARKPMSPGKLMALVSIQNTATLVLIPLILVATSGARPRDLGLVAPGFGTQIFRGVVAYPLMAPLVFGVMGLSVLVWGRTPHPVEEAIAQNSSPGLVALSVLAAILLAPAAEELIFRGVFLGWLTRLSLGGEKPKRWIDEELDFAGPSPIVDDRVPDDVMIAVEPEVSTDDEPWDDEGRMARSPSPTSVLAAPMAPEIATGRSRTLPLLLSNVAVSLVFAALHGAVWPTPVPIFFLSLGLGFLYQRTGSLIPSVAMHMTFNGVSTLLMFLTLGGKPAEKVDPKAMKPIPAPACSAQPGDKLGAWPIDAHRRNW